jgi:hypothetical protein
MEVLPFASARTNFANTSSSVSGTDRFHFCKYFRTLSPKNFSEIDEEIKANVDYVVQYRQE